VFFAFVVKLKWWCVLHHFVVQYHQNTASTRAWLVLVLAVVLALLLALVQVLPLSFFHSGPFFAFVVKFQWRCVLLMVYNIEIEGVPRI